MKRRNFIGIAVGTVFVATGASYFFKICRSAVDYK
jgi:hypothetical protein